MRSILSRYSSPGDVPRFIVAALLLVALWVGFAVASFAPLRQRLLRSADAVSSLVPGDPEPRRVVRAVEIADTRLPGSRTCLMQSLTAESLLRLYGYAPTHRIGVDREGDEGFIAHSWLEWNGRVLIGDLENLSGFEPLPPLDEYDGELP